MRWRLCAAVFILLACCLCSGCDALYGILQKEGAQEKRLLGDVTLGVRNPVVQEIQTLLKLYGYNPGKVDGKLGTKTREAVGRFQEKQNLTPTRFVDRKTWQALHMFSDCQLVVDGEVNTEMVQWALHNAGFDPGKIDGKMGPKTGRMVRDFQAAHQLAADGKIGYQTLRALQEYLICE